MGKTIYNENNGLWYELRGDYYIPCLTVPAQENGLSASGDGDTYNTTKLSAKPYTRNC